MVRNVIAVVAGVVTLGLVVVTLQQVSLALHPLPEGLDPFDPEQREAFVAHLVTMPTAAWLVALLSEVVGAFCGALAAGWIARGSYRPLSAAIIGLGVIASAYNWTQFPHPMPFVVGQLALYPTALVAVWALLARRSLDEGGVSAPAG